MAASTRIPHFTLVAFSALLASSLLDVAAQDPDDVKLVPSAIKLPAGYTIEPFMMRLSVPTTAVFDGNDLLVAESGFLNTAKPRVLRIKPDGTVTLIASDGLQAPVTGLLVHNGIVYVSHRGKVSMVENGVLKDIVTDLPSLGDHHNNQIVLGRDGKIYMGQGTTTNSAVVGIDNAIFGWLPKTPQVHEVPCKDVTLVGENFETDNPLTEADDKAVTGAYKPFGAPSRAGEVVKGNVKCGGSIVRFNADGSGFELVAWGLRNPFGLEADASGQIWATFHGADVRGSRNIYNDPDYLVRVEPNAWYGWPDFYAGEPVTDGRFNSPGHAKPNFLWRDHPPLTKPFMTFDSHAGANGFAFAPREFGFEGDAFIAMYGTFAPVTTGLNLKPEGFSVVRVSMRDRKAETFAANDVIGPAYVNRQGGFNRPTDIVFGPDHAMYVVDWGAAAISEKGLELVPGSGAIWRIYPSTGRALRPSGPIDVALDLATDAPKEPIVPATSETFSEILPQFWWVPVLLIAAVALVWALRRRSRGKTR